MHKKSFETNTCFSCVYIISLFRLIIGFQHQVNPTSFDQGSCHMPLVWLSLCLSLQGDLDVQSSCKWDQQKLNWWRIFRRFDVFCWDDAVVETETFGYLQLCWIFFLSCFDSFFHGKSSLKSHKPVFCSISTYTYVYIYIHIYVCIWMWYTYSNHRNVENPSHCDLLSFYFRSLGHRCLDDCRWCPRGWWRNSLRGSPLKLISIDEPCSTWFCTYQKRWEKSGICMNPMLILNSQDPFGSFVRFTLSNLS